MPKDQNAHGNRAKGRIKGLRKVVNPSQKKVLLRKDLSTNVNQLCIQKKNVNFRSGVTKKGREVFFKKVITTKYNMSLKDLKIDKANWYEEERYVDVSPRG